MTTGFKPTCGGAVKCAYWKELEGVGSVSSVIETNGPRAETGIGQCRFLPPVPALIAVPDRLGQIKPGQMNMYPQTHIADVCSNHPAIVLERAKILEIARLRAEKEMLDYDPAKYAGTGFNTPPTLDQAKAIATVPGQDRK